MHPLIPCSFALLFLFSLSTQSLADANNDQSLSGLSINNQVMHRDPLPFHISNHYPVSDNEEGLSSSPVTIESEITATEYTYLMKLNITTGDGRFLITHAIPDTGSDLTWLNEEGCSGEACHCGGAAADKCVGKHAVKLLHCEDKQCGYMRRILNLIKNGDPCPKGTECDYRIRYSDESSSTGVLGKSKFWFPISGGGSVDGPEYHDIHAAFGVSRKSKGNLEPKSEGIVGLAQGKLSLVGQGRRLAFKFSYCLPQYHPHPKSSESKKGKLIFGSQVTTSDKSTPLLGKDKDPICESRYCVRLASISLKGDSTDEDKIKVSEESKTNVMVIDSGSTFTYLSDNLFPKFLEKVKHAIGDDIHPETFEHYHNCFKEEDAKKLVRVSFEFDRGATMELKRQNFFDHYTHHKDKTSYLCSTVKNYGDKKWHVLGNRAQMDFKVAFDVPSKVSFDATKECSE